MIRPLVASDRSLVIGLLNATGNFNAAELAIAEELMGIVVSQPGQQDYYAFVAESTSGKEAISGFLIIGQVPASTGSWHMYWIAVHPDDYGTGVANLLQSHAEAFVRQRGGYWLLAETSSQPNYQRARGFYQKHGYQKLVQVSDYYKPSDDLILFGKRLQANTGSD